MSYFIRNNQGKTTLTDDAPEWLLDAVREAHDGEAPNEWRWSRCASLYHAISEGHDIHEDIDSLVDIYYTDLYCWLSDNPTRHDYCDEAIAEIGGDTLVSIVIAGQHIALQRMAEILQAACEENE